MLVMLTEVMILLLQSVPQDEADNQVRGIQNVAASPFLLILFLLLVITVIGMVVKKRRESPSFAAHFTPSPWRHDERSHGNTSVPGAVTDTIDTDSP